MLDNVHISSQRDHMFLAYNRSILDIPFQGSRIPYFINVSEFFLTYSAPLQNISTRILGNDTKIVASAAYSVFVDLQVDLNPAPWVDIPDASIRMLAGGFALNTQNISDQTVPMHCVDMNPTTIISINPIAFALYVGGYVGIVLSCFGILLCLNSAKD